MLARGMAPPSQQQYRKEYGDFLMGYEGLIDSLEREQNLRQSDAIRMWLGNAPNIYGQIDTFPRPSVY
jgi:hypothetical protein